MMVQNAPDSEARFVSTMVEHNDLCGQFARAFGNDAFERPEPFEEMIYVISHHDRGWAELNENPATVPETGMPSGLGTTPPSIGLSTNSKSPDYNEAKHLYCGLLSSMHSWGLYHERYGYTDFRVRPGGSTSVPVNRDFAAETDAMLDAELARQDRIKEALSTDPEFSGWIEEKHLFQNYKQLQFCDTLALYFNIRHESEREMEVFTHVPKSKEEDVSITVTPRGDGIYAFDPFPFQGDRLEVACGGRYLKPIAREDTPEDMGALLRSLPTTAQNFTFISGIPD
ncbi:MAG: DUF3891 family protein [Pseudomonadota bacterium]|nr:DUF3891 family protein [Pseudomonadota bacterium]